MCRQGIATAPCRLDHTVESAKVPSYIGDCASHQVSSPSPERGCQPGNVPEEVLEQLDARGVSDARLAHWMQQESRMQASAVPEPALKRPLRDAVLRFATQLTRKLGAPGSTWFQVAALLDLSVAHGATAAAGGTAATASETDAAEGSNPPAWAKAKDKEELVLLATRCVAVTMMLRKMESRDLAPNPKFLAQVASGFASALAPEQSSVDLAALIPVVSEDMVKKQEVAVLESLKWEINVPTVQSWISAFVSRFAVLTRGYFHASMSWVENRSLTCASRIILSRIHTEEPGARKLACGLFCISFVLAGLLSVDTIQPADMCPTSWQQKFMHSQPDSMMLKSSPFVAPGAGISMTMLLKLTTGATLETLQEASLIVVDLMTEMSAGGDKHFAPTSFRAGA